MGKLKYLRRMKRLKRMLILIQLILPLSLVLLFATFLVAISRDKDNKPHYQSGIGLSEGTQEYAAAIYAQAEQCGILEYARYLLAIMQVETGGQGTDVMQSLGNTGIPEESQTPEMSIEYGCMYFAELLKWGKAYGVDMETVIQAYNYGLGYIDYVVANGKEHSFSLASSFASKQCGGKKTAYNNPIAVKANGGWRYAYGNMFYVYLVKQYLAVDPLPKETADIIIGEAVKYKGKPYVWGGTSPSTSFDCSGLVQWCYGMAGIDMPHDSQAQYDKMQHITLEEAEPGDLVFFTETADTGSYITHVGIYVGEEKMFHAGNPLGYADLTGNYWKKHFVCAGRVNE